MLSIFGAIGRFFKGAAKSIAELVKEFVSSQPVRDILRTAQGQVVQAVVAELDKSNLDSAQKRELALSRIKSELTATGLTAKDSFISLALELAVSTLKSLGPQ